MTDLPPELQELIERARAGHDPDPLAKTRVRAALTSSIVAGAAVATTATAKGLSPVVLSLLLAGGGVAAVSVAAVTQHWGSDDARRAVNTLTANAPQGPPAVPTKRAAPPPTAAQPAPEPIVIATPTPPPSPPSPPHSARHPARAHANARPDLDPSAALADELDLVRKAASAISEQRWSQAIGLLDQHAARFPTGALTQERAGLLALSLCKLQRPEGRTAAARFVHAYPDSPMIERLRASCPGLP